MPKRHISGHGLRLFHKLTKEARDTLNVGFAIQFAGKFQTKSKKKNVMKIRNMP